MNVVRHPWPKSEPEQSPAPLDPAPRQITKTGKVVRCVKEMRPETGGGSCIWRLPGPDIEDLFDGAEPGEQVVLEYCEMDSGELDALPEFEGW